MFLDLGCSSGGSLTFGEESLKLGKGLGIDFDAKKIQLAKQAGLNVQLGDCTSLNEIVSEKYDFTLTSHFLEHLPNLEIAKDVIYSAIDVTSKAIFIQQPAFDGTGYFRDLGVKLYFQDWTGHKNMMTTEDWKDIINDLISEQKIQYAYLGYRKPITNTKNDVFLPINAPKNQHRYDPLIHGAKRKYDLNEVFFEEIRIVLVIDLSLKDLEFHCKKFKSQNNTWFGNIKGAN